jgi:hypothetical protein
VSDLLKNHYQSLRMRHSQETALAIMASYRKAPPESKQSSRGILQKLSEKEDWEGAWQQTKAQRILEDPTLDDAERLRALLREQRLAYDLLQTVRQSLDEAAQRDIIPSSREIRAWTELQDRWNQISRWTEEVRARLARSQLAFSDKPPYPHVGAASQNHWTKLYRGYVEELKEKYAELGPQYDLLCEQVAAAHVRHQQMLAAGPGEVPSEEFVGMLRSAREGIAQLQRYTESTKSEAIDRASQAATLAVLQIVSVYVSETNPEAWSAIVEDVTRLASGRGDTPLPAGSPNGKLSSSER